MKSLLEKWGGGVAGKQHVPLGSEPLASSVTDQLWTLGRSINLPETQCPCQQHDLIEVKCSWRSSLVPVVPELKKCSSLF